MIRCFFIGHREASEELYQILYECIEQHIVEYKVDEFVVGQYGGFDRLAKHALVQAKKHYPHIRLLLLLPYYRETGDTTPPVGFDGYLFPEGLESVPRRYAIVRANRYMIDNSNYLIAYVTHPASNAFNLVEYAKTKQNKNRINITNLSLKI